MTSRTRPRAEARPQDGGPLLRLVSVQESDDARLVARACAGDTGAEEALYRRHARPLAVLALHLTGRRQDAEDLVHDTFVTALTGLSQLRDGGALRSWLRRILVHRAHRLFRRRRWLRLVGLGPDADEDATFATLASPDLDPAGHAELAALARFVATLPAEQRLAWVLHRVEGDTLEDAALACGCSLATLKRRLAAAEARLAAHLDTGERS